MRERERETELERAERVNWGGGVREQERESE